MLPSSAMATAGQIRTRKELYLMSRMSQKDSMMFMQSEPSKEST